MFQSIKFIGIYVAIYEMLILWAPPTAEPSRPVIVLIDTRDGNRTELEPNEPN